MVTFSSRCGWQAVWTDLSPFWFSLYSLNGPMPILIFVVFEQYSWSALWHVTHVVCCLRTRNLYNKRLLTSREGLTRGFAVLTYRHHIRIVLTWSLQRSLCIAVFTFHIKTIALHFAIFEIHKLSIIWFVLSKKSVNLLWNRKKLFVFLHQSEPNLPGAHNLQRIITYWSNA